MLIKGLFKTRRPVSLRSSSSKFFEKLANNSLVDHLGKCGFFHFQYGSRSSLLTLDPMAVEAEGLLRP